MVDRVVAAGRDVLVADGYDGFSPNRIAAAAGISPGSLYQYFPDKAAILDVVVDRYWNEVSERVVASLGDHIGAVGPEMARASADALLSALEADARLLRVIFEELPPRRLKEQRAALVRRVHELATVLLAAQSESAPRSRAAVRAWVLVIAVENLAIRWVIDQPAALGREELIDELACLAVSYLAGGEAAVSDARRNG